MDNVTAPARYDFRARFQLALNLAIAALGDATPAEDARLWYDLLDGETPALDELREVVRFALECESRADALDARITAMQARKSRFKLSAERCRALVRDCLIDGQLKRLDAEDFTVAVRNGAKAVRVSEAALLPESLCRITREPNLAAIAQKLRAGEAVPGASLSNGAPTLAVMTR